MQTEIITSTKDPASMNIRESLLELFNFSKANRKFEDEEIYNYKNISLYTIKKELIYSENIDKNIDAELFVFASIHRSSDNRPSLTVHSIGNWGIAKYGGKDKTLCFSNAIILKKLFLELNKAQSHTITLEATHHGPYIERPAVFIEIGSTINEWQDKNLGKIVAKAIISGLLEIDNKSVISAFGIGGQHYPSTFNKILSGTDYAIGHICPKHNLEFLDEEMILQAINKIIPKAELVILDWKGLGQEKQRIVSLLEKLNVKYERSDRILG